ncbi:hypothetical protein AVEN_7755-1 [Araneus ventricosus]|uniref:Uncharacterized protein n=1 Tax=Araneus ventricosus TaxID=182803 RepID=A0A4Y2GP37_ARAVE|nr:hypothetical protein AVEN_7755-1 [Araneus ventricosus]
MTRPPLPLIGHCGYYHERLMRRSLRQRYDPSSAGGNSTPPLLYLTGKRDSAYLYGLIFNPLTTKSSQNLMTAITLLCMKIGPDTIPANSYVK